MASVKDMHDWGINLESCRTISPDDYDSLARNDCRPRKGDILIAKDGSYLKHIFVVDRELEVVILSSIAMLRPNGLVDPGFLSFFLKDPLVKARMRGFVSGVAIPRIVLKDFRRFDVLLPPLDLQSEWAGLVNPAFSLCHKLIAEIQNLRRTRDLLLPRLLSGQIDVDSLPEPVPSES